MLCFINTKD